jgi:putative ABC transport system substrate-binding protein
LHFEAPPEQSDRLIATMEVSTTIPIVFAIAVDPIGSGVVGSLSKPGGDVTGFSMQTIELPGKRIELLRAVLADLHQLAVIANVGYPAAVHEAAEVQAAAHKLGIEIEMLEIRRAEDIAPGFINSRAECRPFMYGRMR